MDSEFLKKSSEKEDSNSQEVAKPSESHQNNKPIIEIIVAPKVVKVDRCLDTTGLSPIIKPDLTSVACQTEDSLWITNLQDFKRSTVASLQDSFVEAFDKINHSVRDLKNNIVENHDQKWRIANLTKEVEKLREENKEKQKEKKCQNCDNLSGKIEKLNKDIDKEKEKAQVSLHNLRVEKELKEAEQTADISLLNQRLEGLQKQLSIQESELSTLDKR